jgi:uroporphyrinogen decarboxylase
MKKIERIRAAIRGEDVDRIPISFYTHNHAVESQTEKIAAYLLAMNDQFDWDFMKAGLRPSYYAEAWGCRVRFFPNKVPKLESYVLHTVEDLKALKKIDPKTGVLADHVKVAEQLHQTLNGKELFVMTLFSPLTVAGRLAGGVVNTPSESQNLRMLMDASSEAVHQCLRTITDTLINYARELVRAGADGIYLSTSVWSGGVLTREEYEIFAKPYEIALLDAVVREGGTFNILHICRENIQFDLFTDYPVDIFNYETTSLKNLSLKEALGKTDKALWGGLDHRKTLLEGPIESISREVFDALSQTDGKRFIIGPGCTSSSLIPDANYVAVRDAAEAWRKRS